MWSGLSKLTTPGKRLEEDEQLSHELPCLVANTSAAGPAERENAHCHTESCKLPEVIIIEDDPLDVLEREEELIQHVYAKSQDGPILKIESSVEEESPGSDVPINFSFETKSEKLLVSGTHSHKNKCVKKQANLPIWLWKIIGKTLGTSISSKTNLWLATALHTLTFGTAIAFMFSYSWYIVYDISSIQSKRNALNGVVSIFIGSVWSLLAVYAKYLAFRMFEHKGFSKNIRFHSKSVLKCSAASILLICGLLFVVLSDIGAFSEFRNETCELVELEVIVCKLMYVSRVSFTLFAFLWNSTVGLVLLAVCRTHTLGIRQFIQCLQRDAHMRNIYFTQLYDTVNEDKHLKTAENFGLNNAGSPKNSVISRNTVNYNSKTIHEAEKGNAIDTTQEFNAKATMVSTGMQSRISVTDSQNQYTLNQSEILHHFWRLQSEIWMSSSMLQRWMVCFICLGLIWIAVNLVQWLSTSPKILDVVLFIIPLIMLPVLCSAYAEVNNEGQCLLRNICPTKERLWLLYYLHQAPLQMTIYGYPIKYSTVVTSILGVVAALTSGVVLQEIKAL